MMNIKYQSRHLLTPRTFIADTDVETCLAAIALRAKHRCRSGSILALRTVRLGELERPLDAVAAVAE